MKKHGELGIFALVVAALAYWGYQTAQKLKLQQQGGLLVPNSGATTTGAGVTQTVIVPVSPSVVSSTIPDMMPPSDPVTIQPSPIKTPYEVPLPLPDSETLYPE